MENIWKNKPFWAIFGVQFLQAFNDNFFRTTLITLITYHLTIYSDAQKSLFISAAFGLFMLPFFVFSPLAGQMADAYDKSRIIQAVKVAEIFIVGLSSYGFINADPYFLLGALFCMGIHSSFFGPAKYSILPDLLHKKTLLQGNGYIEAGTFLAILLGTLLGAIMIRLDVPLYVICLQMLAVAVMGLVTSLLLPVIPRAAPRLKIHFNWMLEMKRLYAYTAQDTHVFKAVVSISWFWLVGTVLLSQLPPLAQGVLNLEEWVYIVLLMLFTVGVGIGSILCNWLLKGEVTTKIVPLISLLIIPVLFDIATFNQPFNTGTTSLVTFLTSFQGLRLTVDILALSFLGGLFIVPLYAFIQTAVASRHRAQVIAFNNILNAGFMVFASAASATLLSLTFTIPALFFFCALGQIVVTVYVFRILPEPVFKTFLYKLLRLCFRLEVHGLENFKAAGDRMIIISNHTSYLDVLLIAAALPEKPMFAINLYTAQKWWIKPFLVLAKVFPIDPSSPYALRAVIEEAKLGNKVMIFPEGRLTTTGSLMKIYEGPGMVAEKAEARLLPIRLEGTQYTFFSRLKGQYPRHLFPKITMTILPSLTLDINPDIKGRARRHLLSEKLYDIMSAMLFTTSHFHKTLFASLLESRKNYGSSAQILEDATRNILTYGRFLMKVFTLSHFMARTLKGQAPVGLMLPNAHGLVVSFWSLSAIGRVPALINYTSGPQAVLTACKVAKMTIVFTSRLFVEKARLQGVIDLLKQNKIQIRYLENEVKRISWQDKLWGLYGRYFPERAYTSPALPEDPCAILFTSGSEGVPKGVVLSHINIQANCRQLASIVDFNRKDTVLNTLPIFHAFGLTAGMVLPLLSGIKTFHYVSPLHYRVVAELVYDIGATILFGADTFLSGYGRVGHVYDFHTLRYVFAGAEKLKDETRRLWFDKFGLRLFEGYGATETGPVIAVNTMMHYKAGTVGRFLPGILHRLDSVEGVTEGRRLSVKGPNVMKGYYLDAAPGVLVPPPDGWYDTGDIVEIDAEGYVTIKGRATRFAKVGGEMVSLLAVEEALGRFWPAHAHAIITRPDPRKGEQLVLFTTFPSAERSLLVTFWRASGLSELSIPRTIHVLPALPLLGSGKVDYNALKGQTDR